MKHILIPCQKYNYETKLASDTELDMNYLDARASVSFLSSYMQV